ncbi:hypothetical protein YT1_2278 [Rhodococcus ruber]|nr:hypothetical protein YT1_2278 [Rhodococcus ruber]
MTCQALNNHSPLKCDAPIAAAATAHAIGDATNAHYTK